QHRGCGESGRRHRPIRRDRARRSPHRRRARQAGRQPGSGGGWHHSDPDLLSGTPVDVDPVTRSAARLAALVAVPVAVLVGIGSLRVLVNAADSPPESPPSSAPARVVTDPVEMWTRELTEWEEVVCRALWAQVPAEVDGWAQRPVTAGSEQNAAYGEPPI